jgi:hypothetical protein
VGVGGSDLEGLTRDLRRQVSLLEIDLRARSVEVPEHAATLRAEYDRAHDAKRTAVTYESWLGDRITQIAVAWVLGTVFVRFCEDNQLIEWPFLAGPGERLADAEERHETFFKANPQCNDRDWLIAAFDHLTGTHPTVSGFFDKRYNALWELTPSFEAASALLAFWRRRDDNGEIRYNFSDSALETRFLGDLYQEISEHARKTFALLQTPEFVEEFILDLTLEPAVEEFGLTGLRTIDPACGSGHFLLGIFHRLFKKWQAAEPSTDEWVLIRRALESVHGCDKNPFAVSIARFRLLVAAVKAAGQSSLAQAGVFPINVAVGDSLMHGRGVKNEQTALFTSEVTYTYRTEDVAEFIRSCRLLETSTYHVVIGNPPYITVKDKQENGNYRDRYSTCSGTYALSVPFAQRLFQLAIRDDKRSGFVGQITANSFMKREFGKKLIEEFFPSVCLTHVIDTSGAYIPSHGTPTLILIGRNVHGRKAVPVRAVLGVRGEPSQPDDPAKGLVWSAIVDQVGNPGSESAWISVVDKSRSLLESHPWSLSGGGAASVVATIESRPRPLSAVIELPIGRAIRAGADEAFMRPLRANKRETDSVDILKTLLVGEIVRDWKSEPVNAILYPYGASVDPEEIAEKLWCWRTTLAARRTFQGVMHDAGLQWWEYMQHTRSAYLTPLSITFAFVATHNHFVLDRGGKIFNRSAPVIKLADGSSEDDHLALLGVLNSSTACFWLKQVSQSKGNGGIGGGISDELWEHRFEFTGTKLQEFPLPTVLPLRFGQNFDYLGRRLIAREPLAVCAEGVPSRSILDLARDDQEHLRCQMIAIQEELDWQVYGSYSLLSDSEVSRLTASDAGTAPEVRLGERAFEIVLARLVAAGEAETAWFIRHGSTPVTEIPGHWPEWYREIVRARIEVIETRRDIALIERPECKRRWASQPWQKREGEALRTWLLDRCERRDLWFALRDGLTQPRTLTVNQLADRFRDDSDMHAVARLYATDHLGKPDLTLAQVLEPIVADQHVPYLAALRYTDTGLRKRAQWETTWDEQREEDRTGERLNIAVPPKYGSTDFRKTSYWQQRGKLDVPKERFVSYLGASPEADSTVLLGWAGWDHRDQAQALINIVNDRTDDAGWGAEKITPLLAGMAELMPWVWQWHGELDEEWGGNPAEEYQSYLDQQRTRFGLTENDLRMWRPAATGRGRRASKKDGE